MAKTQHGIRGVVLVATLAILLFAGLALRAVSTSAAHLGIDASLGKASASAACGAIGFAPANNFPTGNAPSSAAAGDFNGDGRLDLATSNYRGSAGNSISVLLGNGDGTLRPQSTYPTGNFPYTVVTGDFNGDGRLDLAADNQTNNAVAVLLGNGDGTFRAQTTYIVGSNPIGLVAGDFNGDGRLDLATANYDGNNVSVLLGNGDGTFRSAASFAAGAIPYSVAVADFNRDGRLDLAVANSGDATVSVLLGNGDGTFRPQATFPTGSQPRSVAAGDFNGDGRPDLAIANYSSNNVSVLLGNGDGTFGGQIISATGSSPLSVAVADFTGEGRLDLAVANFGDSTVSVLQGNGDGTFQTQAVFPTGSAPDRVVAGDFNGDGRLDIAVPNYNDNNISVLLNNCTSSGSTPTATVAGFPSATATPTVIPGGFTDVPPGSPFYPYIQCLANRGIVSGYSDGTFRPQNDVTRGQLSKIVANAAGLTGMISSTQQTYTDVQPNSPFWVYIERLSGQGAIGGYPCGGPGELCDGQNRPYFRPGVNVSRGQTAKIVDIANNDNSSVSASQQTYTDVPPSGPGSTFRLYIERLTTRSVMGGYPCGGPGEPCDGQNRPYFRPNADVTRGQSAKIASNTFFPNCQTSTRR